MSRTNQTPPPAMAGSPVRQGVQGQDDWDQLFVQTDGEEDDVQPLEEEVSLPDADVAPLAERYLGFRLGEEHYGVSIEQLSEVVRSVEVTPVPRVQPYLLGIISVRGVIVPVVDLRLRLSGVRATRGRGERGSAPVDGEDKQQRVLITHQAGEVFGLLVDEVTHPFRLEAEEVEEPPQTLPRKLLEFVEGIGRVDERVYILLDLDVVLRFDALVYVDASEEEG